MTVTNSDGREFKVVVIKNGDNYGLNDCLTHEEDDPLVEFYYKDWFVSRYYLSTIDGPNREDLGISLEGSRPELYITSENRRKAIEFAKYELKPDIARVFVKGKWKEIKVPYCNNIRFRSNDDN